MTKTCVSDGVSEVIKRLMDADNQFGLRDDLPTQLIAFKHVTPKYSLLSNYRDVQCGIYVEFCAFSHLLQQAQISLREGNSIR